MSLIAIAGFTSMLLLCLAAPLVVSPPLGIIVFGVAGFSLLVVAAHRRDPKLAGVGGVLLVIFTWLSWARWGARLTIDHILVMADTKVLEKWGQLGDLFGAVNALFAAFALVGVGIAAFFQYRTTQMMESQLVQQSFEPLFFKLLDRAVAPEKLNAPNGLAGTKDDVCSDFALHFPRPVKPTALTRTRCCNFYKDNEVDLGPFMRKLFHVFKFIDKSRLRDDQKRDYATIARAALSRNDLLLMAINLQTDEGKHFVPLMEFYGLFKHASGLSKLLAELELSQTAFMSATDRGAFWDEQPDELRLLREQLDRI